MTSAMDSPRQITASGRKKIRKSRGVFRSGQFEKSRPIIHVCDSGLEVTRTGWRVHCCDGKCCLLMGADQAGSELLHASRGDGAICARPAQLLR